MKTDPLEGLKNHLRHFIVLSVAIFLQVASIMPTPVFAQSAFEDARQIHEKQTVVDDGQAIHYALTRKAIPENVPISNEKEGFIHESELLNEAGLVDNRQLIPTATGYPYSAVVSLTMYFLNPSSPSGVSAYQGNGFIVSPHTIVTCAHCLYDLEEQFGFVTALEITFGNGMTIDSESVGMDAIVPNGYQSVDNFQEDLGLVNVDADLSRYGSIMPLASPTGAYQNIMMIGYSTTDYAVSNVPGRDMMFSPGYISDFTSRELTYMMYGIEGQSGSPVLSEGLKAIGLFNYGVHDVNTGELVATGGVPFLSEQLFWITYNGLGLNQPIYRAYNPNSGEHFYTCSYDELYSVSHAGWKDEGVAWMDNSMQSGQKVYRLYNPNTGDHHYTTDVNEYGVLGTRGWRQEGQTWNAALSTTPGAQQVYRLYNPNATTGSHHFTMDANERNVLVSYGWKDEGIAFYSL